MTGHCDRCPAPEGVACRAGIFCEWAKAGDSVHLGHIAAVALRDAGRPLPPRPAVPSGEAAAHAFPLAGDLVEAAARRIGADRLAEYIAEKLGVDCNCERRRETLNRLDARLRRWLGLDLERTRPPALLAPPGDRHGLPEGDEHPEGQE